LQIFAIRLRSVKPETEPSLLRLIDKHISFAFVRERLKQSYSEMGRPSIDPELLLRILLIGYLYGNHKGMAFGFRAESRSPSTGFPILPPVGAGEHHMRVNEGNVFRGQPRCSYTHFIDDYDPAEAS